MINPRDVNLIIFDMDGTIVPSLLPVYESIKRAFTKLGWAVNFSPEDINQFFGVTTASIKGSMYEFITPADSHLTLDEVREKVREEYHDAFREMGQTYPEVKATLATLRKRGYKLAQYTNASVMYRDMIMSTFDMRGCFDYLECIQENNLNKIELVKKIREKFGGMTAAIVGDRCHDIEAARETGCLSIGALYGYGGEEPKQADITIKSFGELLDVFDRRLPIFEKITGEIERKKENNKPFVIGIGGIDGAGKTSFAESLERYLVTHKYETQPVHLDDFHNPKAVRYAGTDEADNYYHRSFNINLIMEKLLNPLRKKKAYAATMTVLDWRTDKYDTVRKYVFSHNTIVIFEGVFLYRKELAPYTDYKIFLDIPFEESKRRALLRDAGANTTKYDSKYLPAQARYLEEYPPEKTADMVIDNSEWEYPRLKYTRQV
jgi:phosphoglycolate phosphatase-like HAD superfamily hydrolase/uridine kinase